MANVTIDEIASGTPGPTDLMELQRTGGGISISATVAQILMAASGLPAGTDTMVQFNDGGDFGGDAGFTYTKGTERLALGTGTNDGSGFDVKGTFTVISRPVSFIDVASINILANPGSDLGGTLRGQIISVSNQTAFTIGTILGQDASVFGNALNRIAGYQIAATFSDGGSTLAELTCVDIIGISNSTISDVVTSGAGLKIRSATNSSSGGFVSVYGLQIEDQAIGGASNWAIKTGAGLVEFGDHVKIDSGKSLTLGNSATTGLTPGVLAATTNASIEVTDQSGQVYRIPCII
jgi:hypothetical protein